MNRPPLIAEVEIWLAKNYSREQPPLDEPEDHETDEQRLCLLCSPFDVRA